MGVFGLCSNSIINTNNTLIHGLSWCKTNSHLLNGQSKGSEGPKEKKKKRKTSLAQPSFACSGR